VKILKIEIRSNPTYIYEDGKVEIKCKVDGEDHRIFMTIEEFMEFLEDQIRALKHYLGQQKLKK